MRTREDIRAADAIRNRIRRSRLKLQGVCTKCGRNKAERGVLCATCRERQTQYVAGVRKELSDLGRCVRCEQKLDWRSLGNGNACCFECRKRHANYMAQKRAQEARP